MSYGETGNDRRSRFRRLGALDRRLRLYLTVRLAAGFAVQIETVAIGWQVYETTRNPFYLGLAGLTQFLPALLLVLVTGEVADRFSRRLTVITCLALEAAAALVLAFVVLQGFGVRPIFALLVVFGIARAFFQPAFLSLLPNIVAEEELAGAIALNSGTNQITTIAGPVLGGFLFAISGSGAFLSVVGILLVGIFGAALLPPTPQNLSASGRDRNSLMAGFAYIWQQKIVRGAISLDLFAVLLGGAVALLPIFAQDVLHTGPEGLGLLRSAPAAGAILVAAYLVYMPIKTHAGVIMLGAIFLFGASIVAFGLSHTFWMSGLALAIMGGADMISIYVRNTLVQLWTPDYVRGRVNAVNSVFIGASNELGAFRAGSFAALWGPAAAVIIGGMGAMALAVIWARLFPELRRIQQVTRPELEPE